MSFSVRPNILKMTPYSPGKPIEEVRRELGLTEVIKLASNENPLGPSPRALEAVKKAAEEMHIYPDASGFELKQALSKKFDVPAGQIIIGNGSDELIHLLGLIFLSNDQDEIIVGDPSFVRYDAAAHIASSQLIKVPLDNTLKHDLAAMARAVNERTKMLFIANPNNPTGTIVRESELTSFLKDLPSHVAVVLDEAYFEFAEGEDGYPNSLNFLREGYPVIGLRTFSKAYGLAGLRMGYGFVPPVVADAIDRAREPFNCNSLAQAAAIAALGDEEHIRRTVNLNREGRNRLNQAFKELGAEPIESYANFVFADLGQPARPTFEALLRLGVIVRSGDVLGMPNTLRVSIGTEQEITKFIDALNCVYRSKVTT